MASRKEKGNGDIELNLLSKPHAVLRYGALSERYRFESVVTVDYATATLKV